MSILTKEERWLIKDYLIDGLKMSRGEGQDQALATICENFFQDALDTIDAMEAERDAMERTINSIESATSMQQVETILIAARAFGVIEEDAE